MCVTVYWKPHDLNEKISILPVGVMVSYKIAMITAKTMSYFFPIIIVYFYYFALWFKGGQACWAEFFLSFVNEGEPLISSFNFDQLSCWLSRKISHSPCDGEGEVSSTTLLHYIPRLRIRLEAFLTNMYLTFLLGGPSTSKVPITQNVQTKLDHHHFWAFKL